MNATNFFAVFLPQWVLSCFNWEEPISPTSVVPASLIPDSQPGSPVSLAAHPRPDDRCFFPDSLLPQWALRWLKWKGPISLNFSIKADPRLLPVSQPGSSKDTLNQVSLEEDPTGTQSHPITSVAGSSHYEHLEVQLDRERSNEREGDAV